MKKLLLRIVFICELIIDSILIMVLLPIVRYFESVSKEIKSLFKVLLSKAPQDVRTMFPNTYDSNGLRFNPKYLKEIFNNVAKMTVEEQAKYVDYETIEWVKYINENPNSNAINDDFFIEMKTKMLENSYNNLNTTAIGNMAHVSEYLVSNAETHWFPNDCYNYLSKLRFYANQYFVD